MNRYSRGFISYAILSLALLLGSLAGVVYLTGLNQDIRDQAASSSIVCRRDDSSVCPDTHSSNPSFDGMVGMYTGSPSTCSFYDACGTPVSEGQQCGGLTRLSNGEANHGAFVGCSGPQNCFCDLNFSGTVKCYDDVNNDSCGARVMSSPTSPPATSTPIPTNTSTPTPTPTGTVKPTNIPTNTPTATLTPTSAPTNTPTLVPTNQPTSTPLPTSAPTNTPTLVPTSQPTSQPTATVVPTKILPSPTRIILPNSGVEFPGQALTVVGVIVTLLGFLILL